MALSPEHRRKIGDANRRIQNRKRDHTKVQRAIDLYRQGGTCDSTGRDLGVAPMTVWRWLQCNGIPTRSSADRLRGKPWPAARRAHHPKKPPRDPKAPRGYDILTERALGNKHLSSHGYVVVHTGRKQRQYEHKIVAENAMGRPLKQGEVVHHINGVKRDNRNQNLLVCTHRYHRWLHAELVRVYGENWTEQFSQPAN